MDNENKLRLLRLMQVLFEETDEQHQLTTTQLISIMNERWGISSHRTTISADIEVLKQFGLEIEITKSTQTKYNLISRQIDLPELKLLIDSVQASKFITQKKTEELVKKLSSLTSKNNAEVIKRNMYSEGKLKQENEKIYYIIEAVNEAINVGKKISFYYFNYDIKKEPKLRNNGEPYVFSPYSLVWNGDYYYMVGYCDKHQNIGTYRIDRVERRPEILDEKAVPKNNFDITKFTDTMFHMYDSERRDVQLICDNSVMDSILSKFGTDVQTYAYDMNNFRVDCNIAVNHIFYSWVFGFGGLVKIKAPEDIKEEYVQMVKNALSDMY